MYNLLFLVKRRISGVHLTLQEGKREQIRNKTIDYFQENKVILYYS